MTDIIKSCEMSGRDISDKTIVITGSTSGIGKYAAMTFAEMGGEVIIHGRKTEKGEKIETKINSEFPGNATFIGADFSNRKEVIQLSEKIKSITDSIDVLCNNAGGYFSERKVSEEGINYTMEVNHIAPFILTHELSELLDGGRVVSTSSSAHYTASYNTDIFKSDKNNWDVYCFSKLANLLFAKAIPRYLELESVAIHPGVIPGSGFTRNLPFFISPVGKLLTKIPLMPLKTPKEGAVPIVYGSLSEELGNGEFITGTKNIDPSSEVEEKDVQDDLWSITKEISGY